jgi:hypothetical protein
MATRVNPPPSTVTPFPRSESQEPVRRTPLRVSFTGVLVGSVIALAVQTLFGVLGAAIGLTSLRLETGDLPGTGVLILYGLYGAVTLLFAFGLGGYVAARMDGAQERFSALFHGIGAWALVTLAFVLLSTRLVTVFGGVMTAAGIGAGSAVTASSVIKELSDLNPRIVTDLQLFKGKAVTVLETAPPRRVSPEKVVDQVKKDVDQLADQPGLKEDVRQTGMAARKTAAGASWLVFLSLLGGLLASGAGGLLARRI